MERGGADTKPSKSRTLGSSDLVAVSLRDAGLSTPFSPVLRFFCRPRQINLSVIPERQLFGEISVLIPCNLINMGGVGHDE